MSKFIVENPRDLLTFLRFDITAKTLYARHREKGVENIWAKNVYEHHLNVWGGFTEKSPKKNGIQDFYNSYHKVLDSIKTSGFNEDKSRIPVSENFLLLNGAHRVSAAIIHNKPVVCEISSLDSGQLECPSWYFQNKKDIVPTGLTEDVSDSMALEYTRLKSNTYLATAYQHTFPHGNIVATTFKKYGINIVYSKNITLTPKGQLNYLLALYGDEEWMQGSRDCGFPGATSQHRYNFSHGPHIKAILLESDSVDKVLKAKKEIRTLVGAGKGSIHTTDTRKETWRNACICFHTPTVNYMNECDVGSFHESKFKEFITETKRIISDSNVDIEDVCVVGSAPLAAYGKRECRDFDIIHLSSRSTIKFNDIISSHNDYLEYYDESLEEIIFNPNKYFYIDGLKFISLEGMKKMKSIRGEEKDFRDIRLIENCL